MNSPPTTRDLAGYFLRLGTLGFGGPIALVGAMHRDLVESRGWVSEAEYREGIALAQLSPGPLAAQLCFYMGYVRRGIPGAAVVGLAFVLPSFLMVVALGWAYVRFEGMAWMQAAFYGIGAAVTGLIAHGAWRLVRKTAGRDPLLWLIVLALTLSTMISGREIVWLIPAAGAVVWLCRAPPDWLRSSGTVVEGGSVVLLLQLAGFFTYAGAFVFGSGLAIVPFLHGGVVQSHQWLSEAQFRDAVAVAMITPGPIVITTGFIGYLIAGPLGAVVAAGATFLPCFWLTVGLSPWFRRRAEKRWLKALVAGITAASVGALAGAVFVIGRGAIRDLPTSVIALAALALALWVRAIPEPIVVAAAAVAGLILMG